MLLITEVDGRTLDELARQAWSAREFAHILGKTKVGCAVLASDGSTYVGCNVEHKFRSHDIHAEINAIGALAVAGRRHILALVVAAEGERFTPCGACMDWIMQFGAEDCIVGFQGRKGGPLVTYRAKELMPHYPI